MNTKVLSLFLLCFGFIAAQAQISEKQLKPFIPKGFTYTEASGEGVKNSSGDILVKAKANDQLSYTLILLRKDNGKLSKIAENENLIIDSDGAGTVLNGSFLTVKSFVGSSSYTNDIEMMFIKAPDGQYYFDKYENSERDYGIENLFHRISGTSSQTGKINFKDANIDELANQIKSNQTTEKEIPKTIVKLAPKGWAIAVWTQGDLNLDNYKNDILLLLKKENEENKTALKLYLQQSNGSYKEAASNTQLFSFTEDLAGKDPNFGYNGGLNFNNIRLVANKGFFTIERRIPNYTNNDYKEGRNDIPFYRNFFHQYYTFKYDGTAKNWFSHRYGVGFYSGFNSKPENTTQYTQLQIGAMAFNQVNCFPNYVFYEPQPATLYGTLTEKMFFEEPNYGKTPQKDKKVKVLIVKTEIPVNVYPVGFQDAETGDGIKEKLTEFQIYTNEKLDLKKYLNKKVVLQGVLQPAQSGHHHTPVLMEVKNVIIN